MNIKALGKERTWKEGEERVEGEWKVEVRSGDEKGGDRKERGGGNKLR